MDSGPRPAPAPWWKGRGLLVGGLVLLSGLWVAFLLVFLLKSPEDVRLETRARGLSPPAVSLFPAAHGTRVSGRMPTASSRPVIIPARGLTPYDPQIEIAASRYGVPANLIRAVAKVESAFDPKAVSRVGAQGLMQLMPATARDMKVSRSFDPAQNIEGGTRYLSFLSRQFNGDLIRIIAGYNAGPDAVRRFGGVPPYDETRAYVRRVLEFYDKYNALNPSGAGADVALVWPVDTPLLEVPPDPLRGHVEAPVGTSGWVRAASEGMVASVVKEPSGTWRVRVQHDARFATVYRGLSQVETALGRSIEAGGRVGRIDSRVAKLRFEVLESDRPRDPLEFRWEPYRELR